MLYLSIFVSVTFTDICNIMVTLYEARADQLLLMLKMQPNVDECDEHINFCR